LGTKYRHGNLTPQEQAQHAQNAASEAKQGLEDIHSELASLKEFAVAQPSDLNQSQTEQITQAFQRLGSVLEEAGIYQGRRAYSEPWKQLGLTMRNSSFRYDLNARKANEDKRHNKALEQWEANGKKGKKPKTLSRIDIMIRDGQVSNAFQAAQQVVSDYLSRL
jgi:hypothetical protein